MAITIRIQQLGASIATLAVATIAMGLTTAATSQSLQPAVFVSNNGNLEGSVTSYVIESDGSVTWQDKVVTGETDSTSNPVPGTNCYAISITPNGRFLAVSHTTSFDVVEQITILEIAADATLSIYAVFQTPDSPLDLLWIDDEHLAVTQTDISGPNYVHTYHFDADGPTLTHLDQASTGSFTTALALHPDGEYLFANNSGGAYSVTSFRIEADRTLTSLGAAFTSPTYPLGIGISPDGRKIYGGGGISNGGDKIVGLDVDQKTGAVSLMDGQPFTSPGASPKVVVVSPDSTLAFVGHGTDATVRVMSIDTESGALSNTGNMFDVGFQGSLGDIAVMDDLMFVTDNWTVIDGVQGLYSFTVSADGSLTQNGSIIDSQGVAPTFLAAWKPEADAIPGDLDGSGVVDGTDLAMLLGAWGACADCDTCPADLTGDCTVDGADLAILLGNWN